LGDVKITENNKFVILVFHCIVDGHKKKKMDAKLEFGGAKVHFT
jgi:hypothetical protein